MKKWLWRILLGLSSCLLVAVCMLWVRSVSAHDHFTVERKLSSTGNGIVRHFGLQSELSRIWFTANTNSNPWHHVDGSVKWEPGMQWAVRKLESFELVEILDYRFGEGSQDWFSRHGFHGKHSIYADGRQSVWLFCLPHWFLVALFSLPLLIEIVRHYRHRRRKHLGLCQSCGYDLRASVDRCPECGTVIAHAAKP